MKSTPLEYLKQTSVESQQIRDQFIVDFGDQLVEAARWLGECVARGGKLLIIGNGGSAADAQHMAAEMVGRMLVERKPLAAIALTTDSSNLTAIGNDYGYDHVFVRQIEALAKSEDILLAISTSGNSKNVLAGVEVARKKGVRVIGLTGGEGGKLATQCDLLLNARAGKNSSRIQETHIFAVHTLVDLLDRFFLGE